MYKIAHISDLHISFKDEDGRGKRFVEILRDIESKNCNHIFITGDLVDNPDGKDLQYVKEILSHFNLLDSSKLSIVPGNHDIFGGATRAKYFFLFQLLCKEVDYDKAVDVFADMFKETISGNNSYPYLKIINNIAIIGINSVGKWSLKRNPEGSNGLISNEDFEKLKTILSSEEIKSKYKLILIHHHFNKPELNAQYPGHTLWLRVINWKMMLYGKKKILKLFKKYNVNLILHGHTHVNSIYNLKGVTFVNSSSCIYPLTDDKLRMYNIISIPDEGDEDKNLKVETITIGNES